MQLLVKIRPNNDQKPAVTFCQLYLTFCRIYAILVLLWSEVEFYVQNSEAVTVLFIAGLGFSCSLRKCSGHIDRQSQPA